MSNLKLDLKLGGSASSLDGSGKMKKLFPGVRSKAKNGQTHPTIEHPDQMAASGHTLDRIVNAKEEARRKWESQEEEFVRRRREHEMSLIALEEAEVARREEEVRRRNDDLDDKRRKDRMIQDAVAAQIRTLQEKLDEYKVNHKAEEENMEDEIAGLEDTLSEVKATLERRKQELQDEIQAAALSGSQVYNPTPSAPSPTSSPGYPTLPSLARSLESCSLQQSTHNKVPTRLSHPETAFPAPTPRASKQPPHAHGSSGSSPQMSHASSSRSATPNKAGSEGSDYDNSV